MSNQNQSANIQAHVLRRFNVLKKVGSGAYGHVWKVQEKITKKLYALKKIFDAFQHATDAQRTYREIEILRQVDHQNIIKLYQTIRAENNKDVYLLFQFMEADLHNVIGQGILKQVHIKFIIYQLAKALKYLHSGKIIHRDLKPSNILVNSNCTIKLCDFGLVRSLLPGKNQGAVLTQGVATRWYRSPEVLLGSKSYSTPADIWSFGCIVFQILTQKPLFTGSSTLDQIQKICNFTGYPSEQDINSLQSEVSKSLIKQMKISNLTKSSNILKDLSPQFIDFLQRILVFNPSKRMTIEDILCHQVVQQFKKPEQQISCNKQISTSIDDNKKFSVEQYRKLVYGINTIEPKQKGLSSSLGAGSVSPKYTPSSISMNKTTVTYAPNKLQNKPDIGKKYSYDKLKTPNQISNFSVDNIQPKTYQKPQLKPLQKYTYNTVQSIKSQTLLPKKQIQPDIPNREEFDSPPPHQPYEPKHISSNIPPQVTQTTSTTSYKPVPYTPVQQRFQQAPRYIPSQITNNPIIQQSVQQTHQINQSHQMNQNHQINQPHQSHQPQQFNQPHQITHQIGSTNQSQYFPQTHQTHQTHQINQISQANHLNQNTQINQISQNHQVHQTHQVTSTMNFQNSQVSGMHQNNFQNVQQSNIWRGNKPTVITTRQQPSMYENKDKRVQVKSPKFIPMNRSSGQTNKTIMANGVNHEGGYYQS